MRFSDIPRTKGYHWQNWLNTVNQEWVSHAQLFAGPEGCGSLAIALAYAQFVSCEERLPSDSWGNANHA
jgi:DNA polymerase-3 subunit delta'